MCLSPSVGTDHWLPPLPSPTPSSSHSSATKGSGANAPLLPTIQNHRRPPGFFSTAFPRQSTSFHFSGLCTSCEVSTSHPPTHLPPCPWDLTGASHTTSSPMTLQTLTSSSKSGVSTWTQRHLPTSAPSSPTCLCQPVSARFNQPCGSKTSGENCTYTERHYFPCH